MSASTAWQALHASWTPAGLPASCSARIRTRHSRSSAGSTPRPTRAACAAACPAPAASSSSARVRAVSVIWAPTAWRNAWSSHPVAVAEWLAADQCKRAGQQCPVALADSALAVFIELGPVKSCVRVQRVPAAAAVLDPLPAVAGPAELPARASDQLADGVPWLGVIGIGAEQVAHAGAGHALVAVQCQAQQQLTLGGLECGRGTVDRERAKD